MEQGGNESTENAATQPSSPKKAEFGSEHTQRKRKEIAPSSKAWIHFRRFLVDGRWRAECLYCHRDYAADTGRNGTSALNNLLKSCKQNQSNKGVQLCASGVGICELQLGGCQLKLQFLGD
ncbi:hypothetical protein ACH5RR_032940 [Cinchona calisaya]|uniref:BED-type domain-containing protein n=1 Tax=Cinchona calisaya TaxID=153742 RepID=A0ABD2YPV3_9GENT